MDFLIGLDLGQVADPTALVITEVQWPTTAEDRPRYQVRHSERMLGWPYPRVVEQVGGRLAQLPYPHQRWLAADAPGVGRPVIDMLTQAKLEPIAITLHGGAQLHQDGRAYRVPKRDVVSALQVAFQEGRLKIARQLPLAQMLIDELLAFRVKIDMGTGHDSYSAWREKDHDDLVLATGLAVWMGEWLAKARPPPLVMERGLQGVQLSRAHTSTPDRPQRPRFRPDRFVVDTSEKPESLDWDDIKQRVADGTEDIPERSPWVD